MGLTFAEHLQLFCTTVKGIPLEKIAKIEKNPGRSKHLETARTTVLGVEVDFVNLRNEEYADDSRIPTQVVRLPMYSLFLTSLHPPGVRYTSGGCNAERHHNKLAVLQYTLKINRGLYREGA